MHEMSIALALVEQVAKHVPPGRRLLRVEVYAGPMRGIDPEAMQWAWAGATRGGPLEASHLNLTSGPWTLRCRSCQRSWQSDTTDEICTCGEVNPTVTGGDELQLRSIEVDD